MLASYITLNDWTAEVGFTVFAVHKIEYFGWHIYVSWLLPSKVSLRLDSSNRKDSFAVQIEEKIGRQRAKREDCRPIFKNEG